MSGLRVRSPCCRAESLAAVLSEGKGQKDPSRVRLGEPADEGKMELDPWRLL